MSTFSDNVAGTKRKLEQGSPIDVMEEGLTVVSQGQETVADVVFIHGLQGHPRETWTYRATAAEESPSSQAGSGVMGMLKRLRKGLSGTESATIPENIGGNHIFWPEILLAHDFQQLRILTYGYDSHISNFFRGPANQNNIFGHGRSLLTALEADRRNHLSRPIIFIAHSLGGILLKEALRLSRTAMDEDEDLKDIYGSTHAIIFFGTPHRGSDYASLGLTMRNIAIATGFDANDRILRDLAPDSGTLEMLRQEFSKMLGVRAFKVYTFQEARGYKGIQGLQGKIVQDLSSAIDDSRERKDYINENHINMCRFKGRDDPGYLKVQQVISKILEDVHTDAVEPRLLTGEEQKYLQDFATFDYEAYLCQAPGKFPGTLQWFDQHETYRACIDAISSQMLMIYGPPGCGKTVIARSLMDDIQSLSESRPRPNFFFCNAASPTQRTAQGILTGLINQCLTWHPSLAFKIARPYFGERAQPRHQWDPETLLELFKALVSVGICRFVLLDGLDECDDHSQIFILENFQQRLLPCTLSRFPLKVIVTCRRTFAIKKALSTHPLCLEIALDQCHGNISSDLSLVIHAKVSKFTEFYDIGSQPREDIARSLKDKADGNFLWATLADDLMKRESTITLDGIELLLNCIPSGLTGMYNKILESIDSRRYQDANMALKWIVLAARPMKVDELSLALALGSTRREIKDVASFQFLNVKLELLKILGPLVKIVNDEVYLVHNSAKEFLLGCAFESGKGKAEPFIRIVPQRDHALLAQACLRYLSVCGFEKRIEPMTQQFDEEDRNLDGNEEQTLTSKPPEDDHPIYAAIDWLRRRNRQLRLVLEEFPFLEYAGSNWAFHAKRQDLVLDYKPFGWLFEKPSTIFQQWKYLNNLAGGLILRSCLSLGLTELGISQIESQVVQGEASPIHIAAYFGLKDLVISIFAGSGADLESAIAVASDGGQGAILEYFLAQVAPGYPLGLATVRASSMGHEDVVSLLLDHGAKADDGILAAGFNGRDKVISLLLERGAHRQSHLALLAACFGGHSSTVEIVLKYRNDLPIFSRDTVSLMKRAYDLSTENAQSPARFLESMEKIEKVVSEDEGILADYWSPLLISSMLGQSKVVEILLKSSHLNNEEPSGRTVALLIATVLGLGSVVDVLLKCWKDGTDLEVSVVYGCVTEHNLLIRTILEKMYARGDPFLRKPQALERALKAGNEEMRRMIEAYPEQGSGSSIA